VYKPKIEIILDNIEEMKEYQKKANKSASTRRKIIVNGSTRKNLKM
jgi:hypothetical protein